MLAALLSFGGLDGGSAEQLEPVSISNTRYFKPKTPGEIKTIEDAMAAIMTITSHELGLPIVEPLYLHLHRDTNAFAANAGKYGRRLSQAVVQFATAVAEENRFHINLEKTRGRAWSTLLPLLAHEYAHNVEYLFSSLYRGSQWMREGFAEWVAAKVIDSLGWQDYSTSLHRAKLEVTRQRNSLPQLSELEEGRRWTVWANQPYGSILTYRLAFLAVDKLIAKGGVPGMKNYLARQDFAGSFGFSWRDFLRDFGESLGEAKAVKSAFPKTEKPTWKIGQRWHYAWKAPGRSGTLNRELVREDDFEGVSAYVVKVGANEMFYTKDSLGLLATASKGKLVSKRSAPFEFFSWPLDGVKEWKTAYVLENIGQKSTQKSEYINLLADIEAVKVGAGTFEAFKIETYAAASGRLVAERWYAPGAKWFVKTRDYLEEGVREEELTRFDIESAGG